MRLGEFDALIRKVLDLDGFSGTDMALNGLQVANSGDSAEKAAFAVDACLESIRRAAKWGADLLFVHQDMNYPGSNLHQLKGSLKGLWSVKVSGNWRITFKFIESNAYVVDY
jgi:putative NIF3 family GTP cyclohydrolase 1 type 2